MSRPAAVSTERSDRKLEKDIEILWVGNAYDYTIPHFHVITVRLRHVKIRNCEPTTRPNPPPTLDVFLCEDRCIISLQLPAYIRIFEGCTVPVSFAS